MRLEKELGEFLKDAKVASCVLFVNDGSKDDSERLIREVCGRNEAFFFLNLARNGGLSAAMKAGIDNSFSRWVGYIDADLQTTPQDFNKLLEFVDQYEMVMGIRTGRNAGAFLFSGYFVCLALYLPCFACFSFLCFACFLGVSRFLVGIILILVKYFSFFAFRLLYYIVSHHTHITSYIWQASPLMSFCSYV